jgi:hypothetical protein
MGMRNATRFAQVLAKNYPDIQLLTSNQSEAERIAGLVIKAGGKPSIVVGRLK